jgi:DNA polymerase I-like protein with 3'-5' exonuclease and polymerase domains
MLLHGLDFESDAIENRPNYPPRPVGLSHFPMNGEPFYYAWGHPTNNNTDQSVGVMLLESLFEDPENEFVFHNAPFDCSIIEEKLKIKVPWARVHDTMLMAFLVDPYGELSLKPLAQKYLGMPPEERDEVQDWLIRHGVCRANDKQWGAHIGKAPGDLVGRYANGDTTRTLLLHSFFSAKLKL